MPDEKLLNRDITIGIGAIFRNEVPYILEWIAYHRALGIDKFFIADNNSDDGSSSLLAHLDSAGVVHHMPFPSVPGKAPQLPAYAEILRQHKSEADWIAFIDADEFLVPTDDAHTLQPLLQDIDRDASAGALVVNWATYGSSHHQEQTDGLVIERFGLRAKKAWGPNAHYKSIVRSKAVLQEGHNPHVFRLLPGFHVVHANGKEVVDHREGPGLSREIIWDRLKLNHYIVKSRAEFMLRKRARGRAMTAGSLRPESFFEEHDKNDMSDPMPGWLLAATKAELEKLKMLLKLRTEKMKLPTSTKARGAIDKLTLEGLAVKITGWLTLRNQVRASRIALKFNQEIFEISQIKRVDRPDVLRHFPAVDLDCGFSCEISVFDLPASACTTGSVSLLAADESGEFTAAATNSFTWPLSDLTSLLAAKPDVPAMPAMPSECRDYLISCMRQSKCYLEYGTGGSTIQAALIGVPKVVAIDSDAKWLVGVRKKLQEVGPKTTPYLLHVDIGPTKELGLPKNDEGWKNYRNYALKPWGFCKDNDLSPDTILVDGRFRAACCLATLLLANAGSRILFDDYVERRNYHVVERFVPRSKTVGRMVEFIVPDALPRDEIWIALIQCLADVW